MAAFGRRGRGHLLGRTLFRWQWLLAALTVQLGIATALSSGPIQPTEIQVCTGLDCRLDGASDCLRMMQQQQQPRSFDIAIRAVPCLGPCGDGPNVVIRHDSRRVVDTGMQESLKESWPRSLVPADMFGANTTGIYQVRTKVAADMVMERARELSGVPLDAMSLSTRERVRSTRAWYDRPRNERLVLQRLMHLSILLGLANYDDTLGGLQWTLAALLWLASNFVMKESVLEDFIKKQAPQLFKKDS
jgi:Thioredoxin-like [2Fe-2S] ferredoxin